MLAESCGTCRFWERAADEPTFDNDDGYCRRYPPAYVSDGDYDRFPETEATEWCGEYQRRPSMAPAPPPVG